jgi:hypothetical protein
LAEELAYGPNAPAMVAAFLFDPLVDRLHFGCAESEYYRDAMTGLFVPFLWYFVGRLIDNRDSPRLRRYTRARKFWAYLGMFVFSAAAALVVASFFLTSPLEFPTPSSLLTVWRLPQSGSRSRFCCW